jgi:hypothetical protein
VDKLTLDTNVIRDWAWATRKSTEIRYGGSVQQRTEVLGVMTRLIEARDAGLCEFGVTAQVYTDFERDVGGLPDYIEDLLGNYAPLASPSISVFPMTLPFVFADTDEIQAISNSVFPSSAPTDDTYAAQRKDALQLYAHKIAARDVFITNDKAILRAHGSLAMKYGITVKSPSEYLQSLPAPPHEGAA